LCSFCLLASAGRRGTGDERAHGVCCCGWCGGVDILCVLEVIRGEDTVWFLFVFVMEVKG